MKFWLVNNAVALDQLLNTLFGGWSDETISCRAYRLTGTTKAWTVARKVIDTVALVVFFHKDHCHRAYIYEKNRWQLPPELRQ